MKHSYGLVTLNFSAKAKKVTLKGRSYLVADATLIVPGVLNGSQGPLYYPPEQIALSAYAWNGMPIVLNHPVVNDVFVSARSPEILESYGLGFVFNSIIKKTGALGAKLYFDEEHTRAIDYRIITHLEKGTPFELSTGLSLDIQQVSNENEKEAVFNSPNGPIPYIGVALNYRPDHLAVLPDGIGSCSIKDGCGVFNSGVEESMDEETCNIVDGVCTNCGGPGSKKPGPCPKGTKKDSKSSKDTKDAPPNPVVRPDKEKKSKGIPKEAIKKEYKDEDGYWIILHDGWVSVYTETGSIREDTKKEAYSHKVVRKEELRNEVNSTMNRDQVINWLTLNCDCWKGEKAKDALNLLTDSELAKLDSETKASLERKKVLANLGDLKKKEIKVGELTYTVNLETGEVLNPTTPVTPPVTPAKTTVTDTTTNKDKETPMKPTFAEMLQHATPEERAVWNNAVDIVNREKTSLVEVITANRQGEDKQKRATALMTKSLEELRELAADIRSVMPPPAANQNGNGLHVANPTYGYPTFLGGNGAIPGHVHNAQNEKDKEDILPDPVYNWGSDFVKIKE